MASRTRLVLDGRSLAVLSSQRGLPLATESAQRHKSKVNGLTPLEH
jgi:hypothetical protein